jgi:mannose-6-phosphate isomerase-like protein (cupin superfamily)
MYVSCNATRSQCNSPPNPIDRTTEVNMRSILAVFLFGLIVGVAVAQQPAAQQPPPERLYSSAADVTAMIAKAESRRKGNEVVRENILNLAPYSANLEHRSAVADASLHERDAEIFYVIDGSATLVTGGKLVDEKRANGPNLSGSSVQGGMSRNIGKGDFILIPENTPHWFSTVNHLEVMSLHVPHPVPSVP